MYIFVNIKKNRLGKYFLILFLYDLGDKLYFLWQFQVHSNFKLKIVFSHILPASIHTLPHPFSISYTTLVPFFTIDEPILTIISIQSSSFTLGFTLVHSVSLSKSLMICIHHCSIIQSSLMALKILCALSIHHSLPQTPGNHFMSIDQELPIFPSPLLFTVFLIFSINVCII